MARDLLECAETNNLIPAEQYGSRKNYRAIDQVYNKRLLCDLNHLQRRLMILYSNDAKLCYDRIVHSIASIVMQRIGMPKLPVIAMFRMIQQAEYFILTIFGDSTLSINGRNLSKPYQGIL